MGSSFGQRLRARGNRALRAVVLVNQRFSGTDFSQCTASQPFPKGRPAARSARVALLSYSESSKALAGLKLKHIRGAYRAGK